MIEKLKPCPCCGKPVTYSLQGNAFTKYWVIHRAIGKPHCECRIFMESKQFDSGSDGQKELADLISVWNNRV